MTGKNDFITQIAHLTKDGECPNCLQDGNETNPECLEHEPWDMPNDDAVETLHGLISRAREESDAYGTEAPEANVNDWTEWLWVAEENGKAARRITDDNPRTERRMRMDAIQHAESALRMAWIELANGGPR